MAVVARILLFLGTDCDASADGQAFPSVRDMLKIGILACRRNNRPRINIYESGHLDVRAPHFDRGERMTKNRSFHRWMISAMGLVVVIVLGGGVWFWQAQEQHLRQSAEAGLASIAQLKVDEISDWRADQLRNGAVLMDDPFLRHAVAGWMALGQAEDAEQILAQFRALQKHYQYIDVLLVDAAGQIRLSLSGIGSEVHPEALQTLSAAFGGNGRCSATCTPAPAASRPTSTSPCRSFHRTVS